MNYEPPTISSRRALQGSLNGIYSFDGSSDAEIKHGVETVGSAYAAPSISEERTLDGRLGFDSQNGRSDAEIKHGVESVDSA